MLSMSPRKWAVTVAASAAIAAGCFFVNRAIDETYSSRWQSASTENAKYRGVFVKSPTIIPGQLQPSDSVELRVVDAWVERPTHIEYRWLFWRREVQDSGYRLVVHLAQVPLDTGIWTYSVGRSVVNFRLLIEGREPGYTGNAYLQIAYLESREPFPDVVHLRLVMS